MKRFLVLLLAAGVASAQVVPPPATRLTDVACRLDGGAGCASGGSALPLTTKGDLVVFSTEAARLPVGTNGFALFADSTQPLGVKWAAVTGTLSGLTAPFLPVAASATTVANSDLSYHVAKTYSPEPVDGRKLCFTDSGGNITCLGTTAPGYVGQGLAVTKGVAADSALGELTADTVRPFSVYGALEITTGNSALYNASYGGGGMPGVGLSIGSVIGWPITTSMDLQIKRDAAGQLGVYGTTTTYGQLNVGTIQQSYSKALVDATATDVVQVPVASNSYEGFTMDYTIFATDATDYQVRQGSVPVAVLNVGGTETCVFGTATEAVNASAGTLTVAFDCTAGTNTVMVRANADTSLASTTVFTIQQRINLTSGTAVLVPQ